MNWPRVREVAVRARELGPTWTDALWMTVIGGVLVWFGAPSWVAAVLLVVGCAVVFGTLGWLDLQNDAFNQAAADGEPDAGEEDRWS